MASKNNPRARQKDIVVQELGGEVLIYDLKTNKAVCLNETSALVWSLSDGEKSVSEINKIISQKLQSPASDDLIWLALDQLKQENLLANGEDIVPDFKGMTRREAIKNAGLASMVALPFVTSLVAPTAAMAQSGGAAANTCTGTGPGGFVASCTSNASCGTINPGGPLCCRLAAFGPRVCIPVSTAGNQCSCT